MSAIFLIIISVCFHVPSVSYLQHFICCTFLVFLFFLVSAPSRQSKYQLWHSNWHFQILHSRSLLPIYLHSAAVSSNILCQSVWWLCHHLVLQMAVSLTPNKQHVINVKVSGSDSAPNDSATTTPNWVTCIACTASTAYAGDSNGQLTCVSINDVPVENQQIRVSGVM